MIKVIVQEEKRRFTATNQTGNPIINDEKTYWETTEELTSSSNVVVAGFLRALANKLDPPKQQYRGD
jgi:hypothetical protein